MIVSRASLVCLHNVCHQTWDNFKFLNFCCTQCTNDSGMSTDIPVFLWMYWFGTIFHWDHHVLPFQPHILHDSEPFHNCFSTAPFHNVTQNLSQGDYVGYRALSLLATFPKIENRLDNFMLQTRLENWD